ncbi:DUF501 domain-containing protein [Pseudarthrobacter sp. J1763]|uniref:DUF501 domain-containing protein n=1 Tax=Pseudarthrobacter sp. J1763 TaxID=3420445 RepID=UPI003D2D7706
MGAEQVQERTPTPRDLDVLSRQLGRPVRDVVEIPARCVCGNPLVAATAPRLGNGTPFPTTFYLTHPVITSAVSRLEANGMMNELNAELLGDPELAAAHRSAHNAYLSARELIGERSGIGAVPEIDGISAGGMPERVKCLHVLVGHSLAAGPGVNVLGDRALAAIEPWWTRDRCYCEGAWDTEGQAPSKDLSRHGPQGRPDLVGREAPVRSSAAKANERVAAIDCGTNSIRLLIADRSDAGALSDVVREMKVVRLGQGVDATGELAPEALERTFAAAKDYADLIREHSAVGTRFVATSASRDARNRKVFVDGIKDLLGVEPEVISGDEEAALSFAGAASVLPALGAKPVLVVDLGGGSTEFVVGNSDGVIAARSVDIGCVRITERHLKSDPPTEAEIMAAQHDINAAIDLAASVVPLQSAAAVVGVAGSITTITAHVLGLKSYDSVAIHGQDVSFDDAIAACTELLGMTRDARAQLGYMHPGRIDVIGAGALVWRTILERLREVSNGTLSSAVTSEHDILDGIALSVAAGARP